MAGQELAAIKEALEEVLLTSRELTLNNFFEEGQLVLPDDPIQRKKTILSLRESLQRIEGKRQGYLMRVKRALQKLRAGTFGECHCGKKITIIDLQADPLKEKCRDCDRRELVSEFI